MSPILFSLFLNDLNTFLPQRFDGLQLVSDNINATLSTDYTEVYLKLFMLLYADDTVILAEKASELQNALDAMSEYCTLWGLKVNTAKTKIVVFCKNKQGFKNLDPFLYEGSQLELIDNFAYLFYCFVGDE